MKTSKTILLGFLLAGAFLALGFVASNRPAVVPAPARCDQSASIEPAVMSQIARARAFAVLSEAPGSANLLPFGF
jgi:hypothetical protein